MIYFERKIGVFNFCSVIAEGKNPPKVGRTSLILFRCIVGNLQLDEENLKILVPVARLLNFEKEVVMFI